MKRRLDAAARQSGRSQSQEAELRLERSFEREDLLTEVLTLAYGKQAAEPMKAFGECFLRGTVQTKDDIHGNQFVFVLEGDADEAVTRDANNNIPFADDTQSSSTYTLNEYRRMARKNRFHIVPANQIARKAAVAVLSVINSSRKAPSREALAEAIKQEMVPQIARAKDPGNE